MEANPKPLAMNASDWLLIVCAVIASGWIGTSTLMLVTKAPLEDETVLWLGGLSWMTVLMAWAWGLTIVGAWLLRSGIAGLVARLSLLMVATAPMLLIMGSIVGAEARIDLPRRLPDLVQLLTDSVVATRPLFVLMLWVMALSARLLLALPSVAVSKAQQFTVNVGLAAVAVSAMDIGFFSLTSFSKLSALLTGVVLVAAALAITRAAWSDSALASPLRWAQRTLVPMCFLGGAALAWSRVWNADGAVEAAKDPRFLSLTVALFWAFPVTALVILLHDYCLVGGPWLIRRMIAAAESPAKFEAFLQVVLDDDGLRLFFPTLHPGRYIDVDGRAVDLLDHDPALLTLVPVGGDRVVLMWSPSGVGPSERSSVVLGIAAPAIAHAQRHARALAEQALAEAGPRLVTAVDAARRDIGRDLHDGVQSRLLMIVTELRQLATHAPSDDVRARAEQLAVDVEAAMASIRDLARGVFPQALLTGGLGAAVEQFAENLRTIIVEARIEPGRHHRTVENTAYMLIAEALTNVVKHAEATEAIVSVTPIGRSLAISISDDGRGGADIGRGTGLVGLNDRVTALGGVLQIDSEPGQGTVITARIPLIDPPPAVDLRAKRHAHEVPGEPRGAGDVATTRAIPRTNTPTGGSTTWTH